MDGYAQVPPPAAPSLRWRDRLAFAIFAYAKHVTVMMHRTIELINLTDLTAVTSYLLVNGSYFTLISLVNVMLEST